MGKVGGGEVVKVRVWEKWEVGQVKKGACIDVKNWRG